MAASDWKNIAIFFECWCMYVNAADWDHQFFLNGLHFRAKLHHVGHVGWEKIDLDQSELGKPWPQFAALTLC